MSTGTPPFPLSGKYISSVRDHARKLRSSIGISITPDAIKRLLLSSAFTGTFSRLRSAHGMRLPLSFPSVLDELNVLSVLSLLNFGSGYRISLHQATGRGAFDNIRALVFSMYISSDIEGDFLSAQGMQSIEEGKIAELMGVTEKIHREKPHESLPAVMVGELGGPVWELVQLIAKVLRETGDILVKGGYPNLGAFVLEAMKEGDKVRGRASNTQTDIDPECDLILERLVSAFPAFQDMAVVEGQPVYCFKKALLTIHAIALRFGTATPPPFPVPHTAHLPIFSDNVIPSLLIHLGIIDLSNSKPSLGLASLFPDATNQEKIDNLLSVPSPSSDEKDSREKVIPKEGPITTFEQAFALRAAAIDACEMILETARNLTADELKENTAGVESLSWLKDITLPELDAWIWAVAKDRPDYRRLERFVLMGTTYF